MNYILEGKNPVRCPDVHAWGLWYQTADRHVGFDSVGLYDVSTVFLGLDHQFGDGPPMLFETMVFLTDPPDGERGKDFASDRYSTWEEAEKGHELTCAIVKTWSR